MESNPGSLQLDQLALIAALRLLVARAANRDSLAWWDDESLTQHAGVLLDRLFPVAPQLAARQLALASARARHNAAFESIPAALHLFRLDPGGQVELAMRTVHLPDINVPRDPITSVDALRDQLGSLVGEPHPAYKVLARRPGNGLHIEISPVRDGPPAIYRARALAWAYLEARPGQPAFPFFTVT